MRTEDSERMTYQVDQLVRPLLTGTFNTPRQLAHASAII